MVLWIWYNKYWFCLNCEYICFCRSSVVDDVIPYLCYLFLPFSLPPYLTLAYLQQFVRFSPFLWSQVKFDITQTFARRVVPEVHAQFTKSTTTVLTKNYTFLISWYNFTAVQKETIGWIYWMWDDTSCISCETAKSHNVAGLSFLSQWSIITKTKLIEFYLFVMKTISCHQSWLATWLLSHELRLAARHSRLAIRDSWLSMLTTDSWSAGKVSQSGGIATRNLRPATHDPSLATRDLGDLSCESRVASCDSWPKSRIVASHGSRVASPPVMTLDWKIVSDWLT